MLETHDIDTLYTVQAMIDFLGGEDKLPRGVKIRRMDKLKFSGLPEPRWPPYYSRDDLAVLAAQNAETVSP